MMTGFGDVLESSNNNHNQSSQLSPNASHQPTINGYKSSFNNESAAKNSMSSKNSSPWPNANVATTKDPYSSFQSINFKLNQFQVKSADIESQLSKHVMEPQPDSPRSTISRSSLPESNSEVVLSALKNLLDKLKTLEIERDKARQEIENLDKERQWNLSTKVTNSEGKAVSSVANKPLSYEAACNTSYSDPEHNAFNYQHSQLTNQPDVFPNSQINHPRTNYTNSVTTQSCTISTPQVLTNNCEKNKSHSSLGMQTNYSTVDAYLSNSGVTQNLSTANEYPWKLRSSNYPVPAATDMRPGSAASSRSYQGETVPVTSDGFSGRSYYVAGIPDCNYNTVSSRSYNTIMSDRNPFSDSSKLQTTSHTVDFSDYRTDQQHRRNYDIAFDAAPVAGKSFSYSLPLHSETVSEQEKERLFDFTRTAKSITVPPKLTDEDLGLTGGSSSVHNFGESSQYLMENENVDNSTCNYKNSDLEKSFSQLHNSTEAVELQFRQAEGRCANLEIQLNSMQKLVNDHKKFTDQLEGKRPSSHRGGDTTTAARIANSKASLRKIPTDESNNQLGLSSNSANHDLSKVRIKALRSRSQSPEPTYKDRPHFKVQIPELTSRAADDSTLRSSSKDRRVSFQSSKRTSASPRDLKRVTRSSRSLERTGSAKSAVHVSCGHYHAKFSELPFVCGTSTNPSHSVNVNLQRVLAALKLHSSACQSAGVTGALVKNMKPPPSGKKARRKQKRTPSRPNSSCSTVSAPVDTTTGVDTNLSTVSKMKRCDFTSETSMRELVHELHQEFQDLVDQYEEISEERESSSDQQLAVELSREQMLLRKKMEAKRVQIDKVESHLDALEPVRKSTLNKRKPRKTVKPVSLGQVPTPNFDTSSDLLKNMQKLQSTLRRDDVKWD